MIPGTLIVIAVSVAAVVLAGIVRDTRQKPAETLPIGNEVNPPAPETVVEPVKPKKIRVRKATATVKKPAKRKGTA